MSDEEPVVGQVKKFIKSNESKKAKTDTSLWLTPPSALKCILKYVKPEKYPNVWECCAGPLDNRNIVDELTKHGFQVHATDIFDGEHHDMYEYTPPDELYDIIFTNPPFINKTMTLQRMLSLAASKNKSFCLLLPIMALDSLPIRNLLKFNSDKWGILCPAGTINFINYYNPTKKSRSFFASAWFCYDVDGIRGLMFE